VGGLTGKPEREWAKGEVQENTRGTGGEEVGGRRMEKQGGAAGWPWKVRGGEGQEADGTDRPTGGEPRVVRQGSPVEQQPRTEDWARKEERGVGGGEAERTEEEGTEGRGGAHQTEKKGPPGKVGPHHTPQRPRGTARGSARKERTTRDKQQPGGPAPTGESGGGRGQAEEGIGGGERPGNAGDRKGKTAEGRGSSNPRSQCRGRCDAKRRPRRAKAGEEKKGKAAGGWGREDKQREVVRDKRKGRPERRGEGRWGGARARKGRGKEKG